MNQSIASDYVAWERSQSRKVMAWGAITWMAWIAPILFALFTA